MNRSNTKNALPLSGPEEGATLGNTVYLRIREDLLGGRYEPGSRLYSEEMKSQYDCGISPLREALSRLTTERLVSKIGQKGYRAANISLTEMWDITKLRISIEGDAFLSSIKHGDTAWEEEIVASYHGLSRAPSPSSSFSSSSVWEQRHRRFHHALISACQSPWQIIIINLLQDHSERYRRIRLNIGDRKMMVGNNADQHLGLKEAALDRDGKKAMELFTEHLNKTAEIIAESIDRKQNENHPGSL